eukprot:g2558.t1
MMLVSCLELLRFGNTTLAVAVAPRAARAVHTLAPAELVQAAQSLAAAPPTSAALESLGVVLGEAICRHRCLDLDQLSTLTAEASGSVLKSLLRHVEARSCGEESLTWNLCSPFYQVLVRTSTEDREAALKMLQCSIDELEAWIKGPYFMGEQLTAADIAFIPWAYRILHCKILERFRGPAFALDLATRPKLAKWLDSVLATEAVKATLAEPEALCGTYKRYADNTALSKVAEAVRQGKTADSV